jgi:hypothetical protein
MAHAPGVNPKPGNISRMATHSMLDLIRIRSTLTAHSLRLVSSMQIHVGICDTSKPTIRPHPYRAVDHNGMVLGIRVQSRRNPTLPSGSLRDR